MKKVSYLLVVMGTFILTGCSNNDTSKKTDDTRILMQDTTDNNGLQRMQSSNNQQTVRFKGKEYNVSLNRTPDDELARVESEVGNTFVDNQITLNITRGTEKVFNKKFTKNTFASVVPADFMKKSILEGMVFDKTTDKGLVFAVSVSYPQTDLYIPISVTVSGDGKMSFEREELMEEIYTEEEEN